MKSASWLGGTAALMLSAALHVGLFHWNPDFRVAGSGGDGDRPERPDRREAATRLDEVQLETHRREIRRLVDSYALAPDLQVPPVEAPEMELPDAGLDFEPPPALAGEIAPSEVDRRLPEFEDTDSDWQPLQEVLRISEDRVREAVTSIPRAMLPVERESPHAPDITMPWDPSDEDPGADRPPAAAWAATVEDRAAPVRARQSMQGAGRVTGPLFPEDPDAVSQEEPPFLPPLMPPEAEVSERMTESRKEITELDAVEALLGLRTQTFIDPNDPGYRYFKIQLVREGVDALPIMPRQVVFLIDSSESMTQAMLREAVDGVSQALETLSPQDTFNVIAFRDEASLLFEKSRPVNAVSIANARGFLAQLRAFGSTDVFASLNALKQLDDDPGRPLLALLVTDGVPTMGLTDSSEIIQGFTRENEGRIAIFTVGGGRQVNRYLLDFLSYRNRGESMVAERNRQVPETVATTARQIRRPVMSHLRYRFTGDEEFDVYPKQLAHLYLDRSLILVGRVPAARERIAFQILGESSEVSRDMIYSLDLKAAPRGPWSLRTEWAWQALLHATGEYLQTRDPYWRTRIEALSRKYGLQVPYAQEMELE